MKEKLRNMQDRVTKPNRCLPGVPQREKRRGGKMGR